MGQSLCPRAGLGKIQGQMGAGWESSPAFPGAAGSGSAPPTALAMPHSVPAPRQSFGNLAKDSKVWNNPCQVIPAALPAPAQPREMQGWGLQDGLSFGSCPLPLGSELCPPAHDENRPQIAKMGSLAGCTPASGLAIPSGAVQGRVLTVVTAPVDVDAAPVVAGELRQGEAGRVGCGGGRGTV